MIIDLSILEIKILLKCYERPYSRTRITRLFFRYPVPGRDNALNNLIRNKLIIAKQIPKPNASRTPVFYEITDDGKIWIKSYLDKYRQDT